jgi:hypothetical protein
MAAPTLAQENHPSVVYTVTGTNVDAGNNDYIISHAQVNLMNGFSVQCGTLTNMTVTISASNDGTNYVDMTTSLTGVAALASGAFYFIDIRCPVRFVRLRAARSNATNEVNLTLFAPKRG